MLDWPKISPLVRVIVSAGAVRSGSTALFNIARLLVEDAGLRLQSGWIEDLTTLPSDIDVVLVKCHAQDDALATRADAIVTCHRAPEAVGKSLRRMGWSTDDHLASTLASIAADHAYWAARCVLDLDYGTLTSLSDAARSVAAALSLPCDDADAIARAIEALTAPQGATYDRVTLLHPNHRAARPRISP